MNILIVAAKANEINETILSLGTGYSYSENLIRYDKANHSIEILLTGVGMVLSTYWLTKILSKRKYDMVINAGIAGALNHALEIGTVVNVVEDSFPETGSESENGFLSIFELSLLNKDEFPFKNGILCNEKLILSELVNLLPAVKGITVNTVHGKTDSIRELKARVQADVESMEGAAIMMVCLIEEIPFFQIRAISNYVEPRDFTSWNIPMAVSNLNKYLLLILDEFLNAHIMLID